jgi:hypothetical protein
MSLSKFSWNFRDFRSIFRSFKQFLVFFWNCFRIKNKFEKKTKPTLMGRAWRPGLLWPVPAGPVARPGEAHLAKLEAAMARSPDRRRRPFLGVRAEHGRPCVPLKLCRPSSLVP